MEQRGFFGDSRITVVRFDPELWELVFMGISQTGERTGHTAREWCEQHRLAAAINAGMYAADRRTHLGYLRSGGPANNGGVNSYQSVAAFYPRGSQDLPRFRIFDLDAPGVLMKSILKDYRGAVQNCGSSNGRA